MDFDIDENFDLRGKLEGNSLFKPANRLIEKGIIRKNYNITGNNHNEFQAIFFGEDAMLYFYNAVRSIEDRLESSMTFLPEKSLLFYSKLPDLN